MAHETMGNETQDLRDQPLGELLRRLSDQTTTLVQQELDLAKAELTAKGKRAAVGGGMFGAAGLSAVFALAAITTAVIAALDTAMELWLAALIVGVVYALIAAVLAVRARKQIAEASPMAPEQAIQSSKEDIRWAKTHVKSGRR